MTAKRKLLARARNHPRDVRFSDLLVLVEAHGYTLRRTTGTHRFFKHPGTGHVLNLQPAGGGKAKEYQGEQLLTAIDRFGLLLEDQG